MHVLILYAVGPLGMNYNHVVWPWNTAMIILLYVVFLQKQTRSFEWGCLKKELNWLVVVFFGLLPALNYAGLWDNFLSMRWYSGNIPRVVVCVTDSVEKQMLKPYTSGFNSFGLCAPSSAHINLIQWSMKELGVPAYPQERVYKKMEEQWKLKHPASTVDFIYYRVKRKDKVEIMEGY